MPEGLLEVVAVWGLKVVGAIVVLIVGFIIAKAIRRVVRKTLKRRGVDDTLIPFFSGIAYYLLMTFVIVFVLGLFGIQTASLVAVVGAATLAVGFALQGTLAHFAAGVMLLIFRPFRVGDYIDAGGAAGSVLSIRLFSTELNTPDNVRVIVPNGAVYGQIIKNYATNDTRRNDLVMGISYGDDIGRALETIRKILDGDPRVLKDPSPVVAVGELADSSVNIVVRPWCKKEDYWTLRFDLTHRLKEELESAGCSIPFPQTDVHLFPETKSAAA